MMYSISPGQIKAARGLLDWTRDDLALACCVSPKTVAKFENGEKISLARVVEIRKSLEGRGIEFVGNKGVVLNKDEAVKYSGPEGMEQFYEDMLLTAKESGGEITAVYKTSEQFAASFGIANPSNLERLTNFSKYAEVKCLLTDARNASLVIPGIPMRATVNPPVGIWSTFQCGNKHALIFPNGKNEYFYYVMTSLDIALNEKKHFWALWDDALPMEFRSKE